MDDERFYELIRRALGAGAAAITEAYKLYGKKRSYDEHVWYDADRYETIMPQIEAEIRDRELAAAVSRENARLAVKGP